MGLKSYSKFFGLQRLLSFHTFFFVLCSFSNLDSESNFPKTEPRAVYPEFKQHIRHIYLECVLFLHIKSFRLRNMHFLFKLSLQSSRQLKCLTKSCHDETKMLLEINIITLISSSSKYLSDSKIPTWSLFTDFLLFPGSDMANYTMTLSRS